ncbi:MAG: DPP IV N-terminal domain-containing protein [Psychroserpens sp.]|uniref:DPP IV N-terminal domain-containing protein n=1 Tax=Psychroserpens sp. TaxID=2020870 RepID=UPI003002728E
MKTNKLTLLLIAVIMLNNIISAQPSSMKTNDATDKIYFTLREKDDQNARIVYYDGKNLKDFKVKEGKSSRGENQPALSKDGKNIAFNTYHFSGWKTAFSKTDGTNIKQIDNSKNYAFTPSFSNDGKWIVYTAHSDGRFGKREIYKIATKGGETKRLTSKARNNYSPSFSPDGKKIAFISTRNAGIYEIFLMNSDGSNQVNFTNYPNNHDSCPSWSPDGKKIAFLSLRGNFLNLYVMNADGSGLKNLTDNQLKSTKAEFVQTLGTVDQFSYMYGTSWSPDGKSIVFVQKDNDIQKLYTINSDGSGLKKLVETKGNQYNPHWAK